MMSKCSTYNRMKANILSKVVSAPFCGLLMQFQQPSPLFKSKQLTPIIMTIPTVCYLLILWDSFTQFVIWNLSFDQQNLK